MSSTRDALVAEISPPVEVSGNKVTVVGVGQVGMACAFSILTQVRKPKIEQYSSQVDQNHNFF